MEFSLTNPICNWSLLTSWQNDTLESDHQQSRLW